MTSEARHSLGFRNGQVCPLSPCGNGDALARISGSSGRNRTYGSVWGGDGINDVIALRRAKVGVSLVSATDLAGEMAQIIVSDQELEMELRGSLLMSIIPGLVRVGGVIFLRFGLMMA